jgi:hypothetical protein
MPGTEGPGKGFYRSPLTKGFISCGDISVSGAKVMTVKVMKQEASRFCHIDLVGMGGEVVMRFQGQTGTRILPAVLTTIFLSNAGCVQAQQTGARLVASQQTVPLTLAKDSRTSYVIALAGDAIPAEKTAASELKKYLHSVTGATFPIVVEGKVRADAPQILVGAGRRVKATLPKQDWAALGQDGIVLKTVGKNLILAGGRPRGSLYAVYQFLEESTGYRWWTPTEHFVPRKTTQQIASQNLVYVPPFNYRSHYTTSVKTDPAFATIMRQNGDHQGQKPEWGGHYTILGWCHTFSQLLPPKTYYAAHPEWYSDPANGNAPCTTASKMPPEQETQLCLTNDAAREELTKQALLWIEKNPEAGYISISQNDNNDNFCRCANCAKLTQEEGSPAGPLLRFVNPVAAAIGQKYPKFKVETLAYRGTEAPPKTVRPASNVIIRLAPIGADFGHPLNSDWNKHTRDSLLQWAKISPQLFVWNYNTNFSSSMMPHPNWDGLGKDLRFFRDNKVKGVFEQGDAYTNDVGDFTQLRAWITGKMLWNPALDQKKLTDEFLKGYYGAAAPHLGQYLDLVQRSFLERKVGLATGSRDFSFLTLPVMNEATRLFDAAAVAVNDNKALAERVRRERLSLDLAWINLYKPLRRSAGNNDEFLGPPDPLKAVDEFAATAQRFGVIFYGENVPFTEEVPRLRAMFAPGVELPEFARKFPVTDVIDLQQGDFGLSQRGHLTEIENDAAASDGKVAWLVGDTNQWGIQASLGKILDGSGANKWHVYVVARVKVKPGLKAEETGFINGIYDEANRRDVVQRAIPLAEVAGDEYQVVDLGSHALNGGMYLWFAPAGNVAVERIYIDRILLIREKQ